MDGYRSDLGAIMQVFQSMPAYQQSLVISELQRTLDAHDAPAADAPVAEMPTAPPPTSRPKPKPKPKLK